MELPFAMDRGASGSRRPAVSGGAVFEVRISVTLASHTSSSNDATGGLAPRAIAVGNLASSSEHDFRSGFHRFLTLSGPCLWRFGWMMKHS